MQNADNISYNKDTNKLRKKEFFAVSALITLLPMSISYVMMLHKLTAIGLIFATITLFALWHSYIFLRGRYLFDKRTIKTIDYISIAAAVCSLLSVIEIDRYIQEDEFNRGMEVYRQAYRIRDRAVKQVFKFVRDCDNEKIPHRPVFCQYADSILRIADLEPLDFQNSFPCPSGTNLADDLTVKLSGPTFDGLIEIISQFCGDLNSENIRNAVKNPKPRDLPPPRRNVHLKIIALLMGILALATRTVRTSAEIFLWHA